MQYAHLPTVASSPRCAARSTCRFLVDAFRRSRSDLPTSDALRVTERFERRDVGHMDLQLTIDDSKLYTRPWTSVLRLELVPDSELIEYFCLENEKDLPHLVGR